MKKYYSLGELLIDYRMLNNVSQADFANSLNVDIRTVQRWEKNETIIKSEKEDDFVAETLLPYQLIRNLNASVVIPTFYDFNNRKYSISEIYNDIPDANWFKQDYDTSFDNIRTIDYRLDVSYLKRYLGFLKEVTKNLEEVVQESIKLLPELNKIITDDSGYYSGHVIVFPLSKNAFERLKNKEITDEQLTVKDLVDYKTADPKIFYLYDVTTDCNNNLYYLLKTILKFIESLQTENYIICSCTLRNDTMKLNEQFGLKLIWEGQSIPKRPGLYIAKRFFEGNLKDFFSGVKPT